MTIWAAVETVRSPMTIIGAGIKNILTFLGSVKLNLSASMWFESPSTSAYDSYVLKFTYDLYSAQNTRIMLVMSNKIITRRIQQGMKM